MITIKLLDNLESFSKKINNASSSYINKKIKTQKQNITNKVRNLASKWITSQDEMMALANGLLSGAFGILSGDERIAFNAIHSAVVSSVGVDIILFNNTLTSGGVIVYFQPSDFANLLSLPEGHTVYENGDLHWLQWLLQRGDEAIVTNYEYNPKAGLGRSGLGNMKVGGFFRVPPQYSGTSDDNFITRALIGRRQEKEIALILQDALR